MPSTSVQQVHQAYYGAVNGTSHGQLASSLADGDLRAFLLAFTDRPGVLPVGVMLRPYLSATVHKNYYLVSCTWSDHAVARPGMVFTHVLIIPLQYLQELHELGAILNLLTSEPPPVAERSNSLAPLPFPTEFNWSNKQAGDVPESWLASIRRLVEQTKFAPVFVLGEAAHFRSLIEVLWHGLPTPLRGQLSWGIRFTPPGATDSVPLLINVPEELEGKWRGKEIIRLASDHMKLPETPIEHLILGSEQGNNFSDFISDLEISPTSFEILRKCQRAYYQFQNLLTSTATPGELLALVRVLRQLQPDLNKATTLKQQAIESLSEAMKPDAVNQAFGLRNLPMDAFRTGEVHLGETVARIVRGVVTTSSPDKTLQVSLLESLTHLGTATVEAWWRQAADKAFKQTLATSTTTVAEVLWIGLVHSEATRNYVLKTIPVAAGWESPLSQTVPLPLIPEAADAMATFCIDHGWWDLFAAVVGAAYEPSEALRRQVKAEERLGIRESPRVERLATKVDDLNLVKLAVEVSNCQQLLQLAGARCGREPKLLSQIDMRKKAWRNIWSISLAQTESLTAGLSRPKELIDAFLSEVASGRADDKVPLELIAASPLANVLHLVERAALWDQLPAKLKPRFITATLDALVEEIIAGSWAGTIEPMLLKAARENEFNQRFLSLQRSNLAAVLAVEDVLHNLSDAYLKGYIKNFPDVNGVVAARLGKLVASKQWSLSAYAILERAKAGVHFRPALTECINLFSKWERLRYWDLFGYRVSKDDAWDLLRSTMIDLYEEGPEQEKIWKRAGGDPARLTTAHTRREQWASAIELLRRGGGGKITADSLIDSAIVDYENNPQLQTLHTLRHLFKE